MIRTNFSLDSIIPPSFENSALIKMAAYRLKNSIVTSLTNISNFLRVNEICKQKARSLYSGVKYLSSGTLSSHLRLSAPKCLHNPLVAAPHSAVSFHSSPASRGLEEFFEDKKNWGQPTVKAGRAWSKDELRLKDYVTLHKLWYVLLKERNMLLSMQAEADRQEKFMPNPERISKVEVSMEHLKGVLKERQEALTELNTGHREEHPGEWQYTPFGYKRYVKPKEYPVPKYMNKHWATKRKWYNPVFGRYLSRFYEQELKKGGRERRRKRNLLLKLKQRFPDSDVWENK